MATSPCPCCGEPSDPSRFLLSVRPGFDRVCGACSTREQQQAARAGVSHTYWVGAGVVGLVALVVLGRILLRVLVHAH